MTTLKPRNRPAHSDQNGTVLQASLFAEEQPVKPITESPRQVLPDIQAEMVEELHELIMAQYEMSLFERRIFIKTLELLPDSILLPDGTAVFEPIFIDSREIIEDSDLKGESAFLELKKATKNLIKHVCGIAEEDGDLQVGLLSSAKYLKGKGIIRVHIDPSLHPYLRKIRSHFSSEQLKELIRFKSYYSQCFYELFEKSTKVNNQLYVSLPSLRRMLGLKQEYKQYSELKRFVIQRAQRELEGTAYTFIFHEKKAIGKKVIGLQFSIIGTSKIFNQ